MSLQSFLQSCQEASARKTAATEIEQILQTNLGQSQEVMSWFPKPDKGEVIPLCETEHLTLLYTCWPPGFETLPHNHLLWSVIAVLQGIERQILFSREGGKIKAIDTLELQAGQVTFFPASMIHRVSNPCHDFTLAIHAYGGNLSSQPRSQWNPVSLDQECPFDREASMRQLQEVNRRLGMT